MSAQDPNGDDPIPPSAQPQPSCDNSPSNPRLARIALIALIASNISGR